MRSNHNNAAYVIYRRQNGFNSIELYVINPKLHTPNGKFIHAKA